MLGGNGATNWSIGELIWLGECFGSRTVATAACGEIVNLGIIGLEEIILNVTIVFKKVFDMLFKRLHAVIFLLAHDSSIH